MPILKKEPVRKMPDKAMAAVGLFTVIKPDTVKNAHGIVDPNRTIQALFKILG
jgi:hypothetical protein